MPANTSSVKSIVGRALRETGAAMKRTGEAEVRTSSGYLLLAVVEGDTERRSTSQLSLDLSISLIKKIDTK